MPHITRKGQTLFYFEQQAAGTPYPPLLLVHGAGGQHIHWPPQVRRLKGVHVIAPDLPGHGKSGGEGRETVAEYTADVLALADALGLERFVIGGHSMGGAIAQQVALDAPERVSGLVLVSTGARLRVTPMILDHVLDDYDTVVDFVITHAYGPTADEKIKDLSRRAFHEITPQVVRGDYLACNTFDALGKLDAVTCPALVLGGTQDEMTPLKFAEYLAANLPHAELEVVEGAGHMLPVEFPDRVAEALGGWLQRGFAA